MPIRFSRHLALAAAALLVAVTSGCNDFLKAKNPAAIQNEDLNSPAYITLMVNGVIGEFQPIATLHALRTGVFGDELFNNHGFAEEREIDKRNITLENGTNNVFFYTPLQRSRFLADSVAGRLRTILGDSASRDLRLARVLAYAGYSYELLAESFCEIPVGGSVPYTPEALTTTFTIPRFQEAITVATAARNQTGASAATQAAADSIINFARIGAARAALYINDKATARGFAAQVPANFEFRVYHSGQNVRENNPFFQATVTSPWVSVSPSYKRLNDPRVPHPVLPQGAQSIAQGNQDTVGTTIGVFVPNSPLMWGSYDGTVTGADVTVATHHKIATGLEARYIVAEADGPTQATLDFINQRRAVGGLDPIDAGADVMGELREQRRRDFFLSGHRLGDMRRYLKYDGIDYFERGTYASSTTGEVYNNATCWPLPLSEIAGNPNVPR